MNSIATPGRINISKDFEAMQWNLVMVLQNAEGPSIPNEIKIPAAVSIKLFWELFAEGEYTV